MTSYLISSQGMLPLDFIDNTALVVEDDLFKRLVSSCPTRQELLKLLDKDSIVVNHCTRIINNSGVLKAEFIDGVEPVTI